VGRVATAGLIGPVNESAWEHFKLFFWPLVLLGLVEFPLIRKVSATYFLPKFLSMLTAFAVMAAFYYIPRALFGGSLLISIGSFALGVLGAQAVFFVLASRPSRGNSEWWGIAGIVVLGLLFELWTFLPPPLIPWLDVQGGFYGLGVR